MYVLLPCICSYSRGRKSKKGSKDSPFPCQWIVFECFEVFVAQVVAIEVQGAMASVKPLGEHVGVLLAFLVNERVGVGGGHGE